MSIIGHHESITVQHKRKRQWKPRLQHMISSSPCKMGSLSLFGTIVLCWQGNQLVKVRYQPLNLCWMLQYKIKMLSMGFHNKYMDLMLWLLAFAVMTSIFFLGTWLQGGQTLYREMIERWQWSPNNGPGPSCTCINIEVFLHWCSEQF